MTNWVARMAKSTEDEFGRVLKADIYIITGSLKEFLKIEKLIL